MASSIAKFLPAIGKKPTKIALLGRVTQMFYRQFIDGGRERVLTEHLPNEPMFRFAKSVEFQLNTSLMSHSYFRIKLIMADTVIVFDERLVGTAWAQWYQILCRSNNLCQSAIQATDEMLGQYEKVIQSNSEILVSFKINGEKSSLEKIRKIRYRLEWHATYMRF